MIILKTEEMSKKTEEKSKKIEEKSRMTEDKSRKTEKKNFKAFGSFRPLFPILLDESLNDETCPKILAVDFDGTLSFGEWPGFGKENWALIDFLRERKLHGDKLILWTCRAGRPLEEAVIWCRRRGLYFDSVNDNLPETVTSYGNNSRKVTCDLYIDDRAVGLIRNKKMWEKMLCS